MLSPKEFTVGNLEDAQPLSLMLPRDQFEATLLVGEFDQKVVAVFLDGHLTFRYVDCEDNRNLSGLLIPNVRIEVDETSLVNPQAVPNRLGMIIRNDAGLSICARAERITLGMINVDLDTKLPAASGLSAGFSRWSVVIGEGRDKRVLKEVNTLREHPASTRATK